MEDDGFELERPPEDLDNEPLPPPKDRGFLLAASVVAVVFGALLAAFLFFRKGEALPSPPPSPETPSTTTVAAPSPSPSPSPEGPLPSLEGSDAFVRDLLKGLSADATLTTWLAGEGLVRRFVAVVVNVAQGENPAPHLQFLSPKERMGAAFVHGRYVIDERSYSRFDDVGRVISSLDAGGLARVYKRVHPLLDAAARDLGQPAGEIDALLSKAIANLRETPVVEGEVGLVREPPFYRFADKRLEALAPAQKMLLRMGPKNEAVIQQRVKELSLNLSLPVAR